jgi:hypothetical protein
LSINPIVQFLLGVRISISIVIAVAIVIAIAVAIAVAISIVIAIAISIGIAVVLIIFPISDSRVIILFYHCNNFLEIFNVNFSIGASRSITSKVREHIIGA